MDLMDIVKTEISKLNYLISYYRKILSRNPKDTAGLVKKGDEYYIIEDEKRRYANKQDMTRVEQLKQRKFLKEILKRMEKNRKCLERLMREYQSCDYDAVNAVLGKAYQGAFIPAAESYWRENIPPFTQSENPNYRNELIHVTSFGLVTRTKGEMEIAELLYKLGIPFRYEMKVWLIDEKGEPDIVYPDFSIPMEENWFYIEHLGLLTRENYRLRNAEKLHDYHSNGILMPGQMLFTMDGPDGGLDAGPIAEFLKEIILPRIRMAEKYH